MGFVKSFKAAYKGELDGKPYSVANQRVTCSHCGCDHFYKSEAQLNTAGMTFLNLDWMNKNATVLKCVICGHLEWFC